MSIVDEIISRTEEEKQAAGRQSVPEFVARTPSRQQGKEEVNQGEITEQDPESIIDVQQQEEDHSQVHALDFPSPEVVDEPLDFDVSSPLRSGVDSSEYQDGDHGSVSESPPVSMTESSVDNTGEFIAPDSEEIREHSLNEPQQGTIKDSPQFADSPEANIDEAEESTIPDSAVVDSNEFKVPELEGVESTKYQTSTLENVDEQPYEHVERFPETEVPFSNTPRSSVESHVYSGGDQEVGSVDSPEIAPMGSGQTSSAPGVSMDRGGFSSDEPDFGDIPIDQFEKQTEKIANELNNSMSERLASFQSATEFTLMDALDQSSLVQDMRFLQ